MRKSLVMLSDNELDNLIYFNFTKLLTKTIEIKIQVTTDKISFSLVMLRLLKKNLNKLLNKQLSGLIKKLMNGISKATETDSAKELRIDKKRTNLISFFR